MRSTPEIDTTAREAPAAAEEPHPGLGETAIAWVQIAGVTAVANLVIYAIAAAAGAQMSVDLGMLSQVVGPVAIVAATLGTLLISTFAWSLVAHRVPAFAHLWVPLGWGVGLVSLGGILGASGVATGVALGIMHLLTTAVAAHLIPRRLPR
jgi:hypothetical protein